MALKDVEALLPKLLVSIVLICMFFVVGYVIHKALAKVFEVTKIDELFRPIEKVIGITFSSLIFHSQYWNCPNSFIRNFHSGFSR